MQLKASNNKVSGVSVGVLSPERGTYRLGRSQTRRVAKSVGDTKSLPRDDHLSAVTRQRLPIISPTYVGYYVASKSTAPAGCRGHVAKTLHEKETNPPPLPRHLPFAILCFIPFSWVQPAPVIYIRVDLGFRCNRRFTCRLHRRKGSILIPEFLSVETSAPF